MNDTDAWYKYPDLRWAFNKLELSLRLGYDCGPSGTNVSRTGEYCVRPIYNLGGMGAGASVEFFYNTIPTIIPAGYFWCEKFEGNHISIDWIKKDKEWLPIFACQGFRKENTPLYKFNKWSKIDHPNVILPEFIKDINCETINTEYIGNNLIEIHLRHNSDFPKGSTEIIPIWNNIEKEKIQSTLSDDWKFIENIDDSDGNLNEKRLGFFYH